MAIQAVLNEDQLGELDETTQALYAQGDDGNYVLDVEGADSLPSVQSLKGGHQRSKRERDEAKRKLSGLQKRFGALADDDELDLSEADSDTVERVRQVLRGEGEPSDPNGDGKGKPAQPDLDKIKANARKPVERDRDEALERAQNAEQRLERLMVDSALSNAVSEIKVADPYTKAVKAMFRDKVKLVEGDDGEPTPMIEGEYGEQPVAKYLKEWGNTDEGKAFIQANTGNGGGVGQRGSGGGKIKNPWAPGNENMTEQARIYREQGPEVARKMAAEHGKQVY